MPLILNYMLETGNEMVTYVSSPTLLWIELSRGVVQLFYR